MKKCCINIGFGGICGFKHPVGSWNIYPAGKGGIL